MRDWTAQRAGWLGLAAAVLTPVVSFIVGVTAGWWKAVPIAIAGLLGLIAWGLPAAKASQAEERADEAEKDVETARDAMQLAIGDALLPVLSYAVTAVDPSGADATKPTGPGVVSTVLPTITNLCGQGHQRTRASWYRLDKGEGGGPGKLVPAQHYGRGVKPSTAFELDRPRGRVLLDLMCQDQAELTPDLEVQKPAGWQPSSASSGPGYRTVLVVPVRTETVNFGVVMVDDDAPNALTEADQFLVHTLAHVLALALSHDEVLPAGAGGAQE